jgi:hypothetical protein
MTEEEKKRIWELFHKAWGQAKVGSEYDKEVWIELDIFISKVFNPGS